MRRLWIWLRKLRPKTYLKDIWPSGSVRVSALRHRDDHLACTEQLEVVESEHLGGRVLGVTALGETIAAAEKRAYEIVEQITFENSYYRTDIAHRALAREG